MTIIRKLKSVVIAATVVAVAYSATTPTNAAQLGSNPLKSPVSTPVCYARELLEVKNNPSVNAPTVGVIYKDTSVNITGRSGAWTNLWAITYNPYGYYTYVYGWTKGKVTCN